VAVETLNSTNKDEAALPVCQPRQLPPTVAHALSDLLASQLDFTQFNSCHQTLVHVRLRQCMTVLKGIL